MRNARTLAKRGVCSCSAKGDFMYCTNCGQALDASASLCPSCGTRVEETCAASTASFPASPVLNASDSQLETTGKFKPYFVPNLIAAFLLCGNLYFLAGVYFAAVAKSRRKMGLLDEARLKAKVSQVLFWNGLGLFLFVMVAGVALSSLFAIAAP